MRELGDETTGRRRGEVTKIGEEDDKRGGKMREGVENIKICDNGR